MGSSTGMEPRGARRAPAIAAAAGAWDAAHGATRLPDTSSIPQPWPAGGRHPADAVCRDGCGGMCLGIWRYLWDADMEMSLCIWRWLGPSCLIPFQWPQIPALSHCLPPAWLILSPNHRCRSRSPSPENAGKPLKRKFFQIPAPTPHPCSRGGSRAEWERRHTEKHHGKF